MSIPDIRQIHPRIWALAGPMILSNLTVPMLGMVDTAVLGHLPEPHYLAAVAIGALVFSFLFWGFGFLRMGTTGLAAQAEGRGDGSELRAILGRGLFLSVVLGVLLILCRQQVEWLAFQWFEASHVVLELARSYYAVRIWSAPAALANYVVLGWFLGLQNARVPLAIMVTTNLVNIVLDLWFVLGLGWGVSGVALATVLADYGGLALGLILVALALKKRQGNWQLGTVLVPERLRQLVAVNTDIFVRTISLMVAFAFFTAQGAKQGEVVLAANAVLMNLQTFMAFGLDGFAHAAEALVGRSLGARDRGALRQVLRGTAFWSIASAAVFAIVYGGFGHWIVDALTDIAEVRGHAEAYLPWLVLSPLVSVWSFWLDGVFIGAVRTRTLRNSMLLALLGVYFPAWALTQPLGNHGLWLALLAFMAARGATLGYVLAREPSLAAAR